MLTHSFEDYAQLAKAKTWGEITKTMSWCPTTAMSVFDPLVSWPEEESLIWC